jgi:hypothetical protein
MPGMPEAEAEEGSRNESRALSAQRPRCRATPEAVTPARLLLGAERGSLIESAPSATNQKRGPARH